MIAGLGPLIVQALVMSAAGAAGDIAVRHFWEEIAGDKDRQEKFGVTTVRLLQVCLNLLGANIPVDGDYGKLTFAAVKNFQNSAGITVDGLAGDETLAAVVKALERKLADGK